MCCKITLLLRTGWENIGEKSCWPPPQELDIDWVGSIEKLIGNGIRGPSFNICTEAASRREGKERRLTNIINPSITTIGRIAACSMFTDSKEVFSAGYIKSHPRTCRLNARLYLTQWKVFRKCATEPGLIRKGLSRRSCSGDRSGRIMGISCVAIGHGLTTNYYRLRNWKDQPVARRLFDSKW